MKIYTARKNETVKEIAKAHGVPESILRRMNGIDGEPLEGEELLITFPTRAYTVREGDTLERLAIRFGVGKGLLREQNPWLGDKDPRVGECITLKTGEKPHGTSLANGTYYRGCPEEKLDYCLPYLTYLTVASAYADASGLKRLFPDKDIIEKARRHSKTPLIRIYDGYPERYAKMKTTSDFSDKIIDTASRGGYKGVVLNAAGANKYPDEYTAFIVDLKKKMIGCDLILVTETDEESPSEFSDHSDGCIFSYAKYIKEPKRSFDDGERRILADLACKGEGAKTFIDLSHFARGESELLDLEGAIKRARDEGSSILNDNLTRLSRFSLRRGGEYVFTPLSYLLEIFGLIDEYGFMGVSFDIMRIPKSHLSAYFTAFKTAYFPSVISREGCNRAL